MPGAGRWLRHRRSFAGATEDHGAGPTFETDAGQDGNPARPGIGWPGNHAGRPRVQVHVLRVCCVVVTAVASVAILTGCSGRPDPHQTVTGLLVRVGGPAPGSPVPLPGTVLAQTAAGDQFTTTTDNDGRFRLSLPPGSYRLTGHSPQVMGDGQQALCRAMRPVRVTGHKPVHHIWVVCSVP